MTTQWPVRATSLWAGAGALIRSSRWHRRLGWAVATWLLVWVLAYVTMPFAVKWQLQKLGAEKLGR